MTPLKELPHQLISSIIIGTKFYKILIPTHHVFEFQNKLDLNKSKIGNLESLISSKNAKIDELRKEIEEAQIDMNHSSSQQSSLGGQLAALRDEKTDLSKQLLNAQKVKSEVEHQLDERNTFVQGKLFLSL